MRAASKLKSLEESLSALRWKYEHFVMLHHFALQLDMSEPSAVECIMLNCIFS